MSKIRLGIIGLGYIFNDYLKVIRDIKNFEIRGVITKSQVKAKNFAKDFKKVKVYKSIDLMMLSNEIDAVIVLVPPEKSFEVLKKIIPYKKPFFTEKPVGLNFTESHKLFLLTKKFKTLNMVGYNRRFYSIFDKGLSYINQRGGIKSILIEGHERFWKINKKRNKKLLDNWLFANSIHTIDLLRLFGKEYSKSIYSIKQSTKNNKGDQFAIILKSKKNIISTYISSWYAPAGWSIKLFGDGVTIIYEPLEKGFIIDKDFKTKVIKPSKYDIIYKPGFYKQLQYFKNLITSKTLTWPAQDIKENIKSVNIANKIIS